ncbi:MAG TPA: hypothetical protein VGH91_08750 [Gammaproteobacteria bacterium]
MSKEARILVDIALLLCAVSAIFPAKADGVNDAVGPKIIEGAYDTIYYIAHPGLHDKPLIESPIGALRGKDAVYIVYPQAEMSARVSSWLILRGQNAPIDDGNEIIREDGIQDPAIGISRILMKALSDSYGIKPALDPIRAPGVDMWGQTELTGIHGTSRLVLSVITFDWIVNSYTLHPTKYWMLYRAQLRLVDIDQGTVLAQGSCGKVPDYGADSPTKDQMLANKGEFLKKMLQTQVDNCVTQLETETLNTSRASPRKQE